MKDRLLLIQIFYANNRSGVETIRKFCTAKGYKTKEDAPIYLEYVDYAAIIQMCMLKLII